MDGENKDKRLGKNSKNKISKNPKELKKKIISMVVSALTPLIITIFIISIFVGIVLYIKQSVLNFLGLNKNDVSSIQQNVKAAVYLSSDGRRYQINDAYVDSMVNAIKMLGIEPSTTGLVYSEKNALDKDGNIKESMIKKYVKAEAITMLPKIGSSGMDGIITIYRDFGEEDGEAKKLTYVPYNTFVSYVDKDYKYATQYFSLNPKNFDLCYATEEVVQCYNEKGKRTSETVSMTKNEVDYQNLISAYAMPTNFTISTHMIAQNVDFMKDLLDLVSSKSEIVLTLKDSVSTTTTTVDYSGKYYEYTNLDANYSIVDHKLIEGEVVLDTGEVTVTRNDEYDVDNKNVNDYYDGVDYFKKVDSKTTSELVVSKADTWIASKESTYTKKTDEIVQDEQSTEINVPDDKGVVFVKENETVENPYPINVDNSVIDKIKENVPSGKGYKIDKLHTYVTNKVELIKTVNESTTNTVYNEVNGDTDLSKVDDLIDLFSQDKYKKVMYNFKTSAQLYFKMLSLDEKTQDIEQIMKYVLYKINGTKYGVEELEDLSKLFEQNMDFVGEGDYMVNTAMSDASIVIKDKTVLEKAINAVFSGQAKQNLLNNVSSFLGMQEKYNVNAVFAIAVTRAESGCGTQWSAISPDTYNWMSVTGDYNGATYKNPNSSNDRTWRKYPSYEAAVYDFGDIIAEGTYYFKSGRNSVLQIAPTYCNAEWGLTVVSYMNEIFQAAGINVSTDSEGQQKGEEIEDSEKNVSAYSYFGRKYVNYKQLKYVTVPPYYNATGVWGDIKTNGCMPSSIAIVASGYGKNSSEGSLYTPATIVKEILPGSGGMITSGGPYSSIAYLQSTVQKLGLDCTWRIDITDKAVAKKDILEHLGAGKPIIVHASRGYYTNDGHFMAVVGLDGNNVYVSNPGSMDKTGYTDIDELLNRNVNWYVRID